MSNLLVWDCVENLPKALVGVHLLRWIATYPLDKVIRSLSNWGQNNILYFPSQYGFRRKHSTNLATIELITKISQAI